MICYECTKKLPVSAFFTQKEYGGVDYNYWYRRSPICKACFLSKYVICRKCHRHFDKNTMLSNNLCYECYAKAFFCEDCHKELERYEVHKRGGVIRCAECDARVFGHQSGIKDGVVLTDTVNVIVYSRKVPCPSHPDSVGCVTAYAIGIEDAQSHPINVFYCAECCSYYINNSQYLSFARQYGLPLLNIEFQRQDTYGPVDFSEWNQQSILNFLGYNVNAGDNLSDSERQRILEDCIDTKMMSKAQVCSFLEGMISLHEKRENFYLACRKWETDLIYIRNYRMNEQRFIHAKFVMSKYSKSIHVPK